MATERRDLQTDATLLFTDKHMAPIDGARYPVMLNGYQQADKHRYDAEIALAGDPVFNSVDRPRGERHHIINASSVAKNEKFMREIGFFTDSQENLIFLPNSPKAQLHMTEMDKRNGHDGVRVQHTAWMSFRQGRTPEETERNTAMGRHIKYSENIDRDVKQIAEAYFAGDLDKGQAREQVAALVHSLRLDLMKGQKNSHINNLYDNRQPWTVSKGKDGPAR